MDVEIEGAVREPDADVGMAGSEGRGLACDGGAEDGDQSNGEQDGRFGGHGGQQEWVMMRNGFRIRTALGRTTPRSGVDRLGMPGNCGSGW